jgi:hypothetical protein
VPVNPDVAGQMSALTVFTPVMPEREAGLRAYLDQLAPGRGPLEQVPGTHFGRFVLVDDFAPDPSQTHPEHLPAPYLLFSVTVDGPAEDWLDGMCEGMPAEAETIWGACAGAPQPAAGAALKGYLLHTRIRTSLFFSAYPAATVEQVRASLDCRTKTAAFALRAQGMAPAELQQAFLAEFGA